MAMLGGRVRSPAVVVLAVVLAGIGGAVAVYRSGSGIREHDRVAYLAWERQARPAVERARAIHADLPDLASRARALDGTPDPELSFLLTKSRATLEQARETMLAARIEPILRSTAALYLEGIAHDLRAVGHLQDIAGSPDAPGSIALFGYQDAHELATDRYREADAARARLRQRLKLEAG